MWSTRHERSITDAAVNITEAMFDVFTTTTATTTHYSFTGVQQHLP